MKLDHQKTVQARTSARQSVSRAFGGKPGVTYTADLKPGAVVEILGSDGTRMWMSLDAYRKLNGVDWEAV